MYLIIYLLGLLLKNLFNYFLFILFSISSIQLLTSDVKNVYLFIFLIIYVLFIDYYIIVFRFPSC